MLDVFRQVVMNLRANKLRNFLTMFGILWGVISVVILSATAEGFRRGNEKVLTELGRNIAIVWGVRTGMQAGGERAGRQVLLTVDDVRALQTRSTMIAVVSAEIQRGAINVKSSYNAGAITVDGIEPQYQEIRTIVVDRGTYDPVAGTTGDLYRDTGGGRTRQLAGSSDSCGENGSDRGAEV